MLGGLAFLAAFASMWTGIIWLISRIGGWARLAKEYRAELRREGMHFSMRSLHIAPMTGYNRCLEVTLSRDGIYLVPFALFRFGHAPLLIPWDRVGKLEERRFLIRRYILPIQAAGMSLRLDVPSSVADWMSANLPGSTGESQPAISTRV